MTQEHNGLRLNSIRPLVRYVDEYQAVIDVHFDLVGHEDGESADEIANSRIDVEIEMTGIDGYTFQHRARAEVNERRGLIRFEMKRPRRWWPLGMGEQFLYDLTIMLVLNDDVAELWQTTIGLTSVRVPDSLPQDESVLLVNGQVHTIQTIIPVEPVDEFGLLAVGSDALLLVRDHYGPDVLYDAADRTGILLIQSIPMPDETRQQPTMRAQVDRLAAHPSLAGWFVDRSHAAAPHLTRLLRQIDPTRHVMDRLPRS